MLENESLALLMEMVEVVVLAVVIVTLKCVSQQRTVDRKHWKKVRLWSDGVLKGEEEWERERKKRRKKRKMMERNNNNKMNKNIK